MGEDETYKYLGIMQAKLTDHTRIKNGLKDKFVARLNQICRSKLVAKHLMKAINSYAIPVLTYSFGVIKWTPTNLESLQRPIRTKLTANNCHHPRSAVERLILPRTEGGRGLIDISDLQAKQVTSLRLIPPEETNIRDAPGRRASRPKPHAIRPTKSKAL